MGNTLTTPQQQQQQHHQRQRQQQQLQQQQQQQQQKTQHNGEDEEPEPPDSQAQTQTCEICYEPIVSPNKIFTNRGLCAHPVCVDCTIKYIQVKLEDNAAEIPCPAPHCSQSLDAVACREILPRPTFVRWCDALCDAFLLGREGCYCPYRYCSVMVINECGGDVKRSRCPNCKRLFCFKCKMTWHAGFRCDEGRELRDENDVAFGVLAERERWMRCPRCRHFVQRVEGCKIIRCRCRISFCYRCGKQVNQHWCGCDAASMCCVWCLRIITALVCAIALYAIFPILARSIKLPPSDKHL